jgi:hypothetical protein
MHYTGGIHRIYCSLIIKRAYQTFSTKPKSDQGGLAGWDGAKTNPTTPLRHQDFRKFYEVCTQLEIVLSCIEIETFKLLTLTLRDRSNPATERASVKHSYRIEAPEVLSLHTTLFSTTSSNQPSILRLLASSCHLQWSISWTTSDQWTRQISEKETG